MILGRSIARNARIFGDKPAIVEPDVRVVTHDELLHRTNRLASALIGRGITRGSKLAILARNSAAYLETYFAAGRIGVCLVPVNFHLKPADIGDRLLHSDAAALVVDGEFLPLLEELPAAVRERLAGRIFGIADDACGASLESLIDSGVDADPDVFVSAEDPLYIGYTSGTTGPPKGAIVSHRAIVVGYLYKALDYELDEHDVNLDPGPFWHSAPRDFATLAVYLGGTCIVTRHFDPAGYYELVQRYRVTNSFVVPSMVQMLTEFRGNDRFDASSLHLLLSGGSPLPTVVKERALARFGPILQEFYGATETRIVTNIRSGDLQQRHRCVGRPIRDVEIRILDPEGDARAPGEVGEVFVRGPGLFSGYHRDPERTRASHRGEWFSLGDMGRMDEEGYLYLVDRKQDMIISGGENIFPNDVEEVILGFPGVKEAAVIGTPDEVWGEVVTAVVVPREGVDVEPERLIEHCARALPGYMKPRRVEFADGLPRNAVGKVLRRVLREPYWEDREQRI